MLKSKKFHLIQHLIAIQRSFDTCCFVSKFLNVFLSLVLFTGCSVDGDEHYTVDQQNEACLRGKISGQYIVKMIDGSHELFSASSISDLKTKLESSNKSGRVVAVDFNYKIEAKEQTASLPPPGELEDANLGPKILNAPFLWGRGFFGKGAVTALIDSGYDVNHPFLKDSVFVNSLDQGSDEDQNGFVGDLTGWDFINDKPLNGDLGKHGTYVGSVIAANHAPNVQTSMAPESKILPIAALETGDGVQTKASGDSNNIIKAFDYAIQSDVDIINASWAGYICSEFIRDKIKEATDKGIFVVTAAGNEKNNLDEKPIFPGSLRFPLVVAVGALNHDLSIEKDSNFGSLVDFFALGSAVPAAAPQTQFLHERPSGTSLSTPFISGAIALLKSAFPERSSEALMDALLNSRDGRKIPNLERAYKELNLN